MKLTSPLAVLFITLVLLATSGHAQEQFAGRIVKYSSQAGSKAYAARQVLGKPNALEYGKNPVAWSPAAPNVGLEYIEVAFDDPMKIQQVAIWENFNPGSVYQIFLIDRSGKSHKVFERNKPEKPSSGNRIFRYMMKQTSYEVSGLKLVLNTAEVYGLNQIDAIGISSTSKPMESQINIPKDKSFVGKPENLGYKVNCEDPDLLPIISVDGQHLYFARKHHINNLGSSKNDDIYVAQKDRKGGWTEAVNIGKPLNNEYNNFVCAVNPDGTEVLLSGRYTYRGESKEGLHTTKLKNGVWSDPKPIVIENYRNLSAFVCYHVSPDMKYLVIAMEHPDTYGDMDIYVSFRKSDGRYSSPKNLGSQINTAGTEPSVFLSADGKTIYFSSDGHPGYGAYDMYMSRRLDNSWSNWTEPVNLGPAINSADWDLYYTVPANGEYAYYSSEHNSYGRSDLYRIKLPKDVRPEPVAIVKPNFVNVKTNSPVAKVNTSNKTIVIQDDSRLNLYEEVKGFYPVNESEDLSAELEEEDDFEQPAADDAEIREVDQKMEDLLARLQELKNEQAKTSTAYEKDTEPVSRHVVTDNPVEKQEVRPEAAKVTSDLDDRLAALRSDMERISEGKQPLYSNSDSQPSKSYNVKPAYKVSDKQVEKQDELTESQSEMLDKLAEQEAVISDLRENASTGSVSPREAVSKTYDLKERTGDDFMADHQNYRDRLEELKKQKSGVASQPLTKYAISRTAIDDEMEDALVASSLDNELDELKQRQSMDVDVDPEVEAYRKKLEELKKENEEKFDDLPTGKRITKKNNSGDPDEDTPAEVVDEEVLAFQKKLEEMKARMNEMPTISQDDVASVQKTTAPERDENEAGSLDISEEEDKVLAKTDGRNSRLGRKKKGNDISDKGPEIAEVIMPEKKATVDDVVHATTLDENTGENPVVAPNALDEEKDEVAADLAEEAAKRDELEAMNSEMTEEIEQLDEEAAEARKANDDLRQEQLLLEEDRLAMEAEKQELEDIISQLEEERKAFLDEQKKLESDRKQLEQLRLQQHQQVKKLEQEIAALEKEKGVALTAANDAKAAAPVMLDPDAEIFLMPVEAGVTIEIRNVFFNANSAFIKPQSYKELDKVVSFLSVNSNISVEIGGHTNGICQASYCNSLSEKRAKAVSEYIINKGIHAYRLDYKGYGKQFPVADNNTAEGRKKNQRVELKIIKVD